MAELEGTESARKQAEETLWESEKRYRTLFKDVRFAATEEAD